MFVLLSGTNHTNQDANRETEISQGINRYAYGESRHLNSVKPRAPVISAEVSLHFICYIGTERVIHNRVRPWIYTQRLC